MKLKLITPLLLIVSTLFFVANANAKTPNAKTFNVQGALDAGYTQEQIDRYLATGQNVAQPTPKKKTPKEIEDRKKSTEKYRYRMCALDAGKAGTEYAAKQIEKTCLEEYGLKPKGWFDW